MATRSQMLNKNSAGTPRKYYGNVAAVLGKTAGKRTDLAGALAQYRSTGGKLSTSAKGSTLSLHGVTVKLPKKTANRVFSWSRAKQTGKIQKKSAGELRAIRSMAAKKGAMTKRKKGMFKNPPRKPGLGKKRR